MNAHSLPALILVRHAQSVGNADGLMQGQGEFPLSAGGRAQAAAARAHVACWGLPVVASSDLGRAVETAHLLGAGDDVLLDARLRERDAGRWTGMDRVQMERELGRPLDDGWRPDDFESLAVVATRMRAAVVDLLGRGVRGVVVTHGASMRVLEASLGGSDAKFENLAGLAFDESGAVLGRLPSLVSVEHLCRR